MAAAALPIILKLGGLAEKIGLNQLLQHSLRLKNAQSENAALANVVDAYDSDLQMIVSAVNSGQTDPATAIQALQQLDQNIYNYLRGSITVNGAFRPGTAWDDATGVAGKCNKQCTAGCCVYFGDLGPPLSLAQVVLGGSGGRWRRGDPRLLSQTSTGGTIQVPEVFASKYGGQDRPAYTITISVPPPASQVQATLQQTVAEMLGTTPTQNLQTSEYAQTVLPPASPFAASLTNSYGAPANPYTPLLLFAGVALLFGALLLAVLGRH